MSKKDYASYVAMDGHEGYYQNPLSKRIRYTKVHNGSIVTVSTKQTKITDAKKVVDKHLSMVFSDNPKKDVLLKQGIQSPTIKYCWEEIMEERDATREGTTKKGYDVSWRIGIEPFWGGKTVLDFTPANMRAYEKWYLKKHPTRVFFNTGKHLTMLIKYCHDNGYIKQIVRCEDLDLIIRARNQMDDVGRVYTDEELQGCLEHAFSEMVRVGVLCYRYMGMRKNELLTSRRNKWDLKKRTATLWSAKNKKWRTIIIPEIVAGPLELWINSCPESQWLFPALTNPSKYTSSQVFDEQWTKTKIAAQIKDATVENAARIHDWRHTFATQTALDGWPVRVACYVLDMSMSEYEETYTHITEADILRLMIKSFGALK